MTTQTLGRWTIGYGALLIACGALLIACGALLIACGVAGYLSNPGKAATALLSGGTFGSLAILWGWLIARGVAWSRWAALVTSALLLAVFSWRATVGWLAVAGGNADKLTAATLITVMGAASLATVAVLLRAVVRGTRPTA